MAGTKIRIKLRAYDHRMLDVAARDIVEHVQRTGAKVVGPVPLPTERNIYTVIRSPHKDKDSREHFQMLTHKRLLDIHDATPKTVQELQRLQLSAGVDIEIKLEREFEGRDARGQGDPRGEAGHDPALRGRPRRA